MGDSSLVPAPRVRRRYAERLPGRRHILPLDVLVLDEISKRVAEEGRSDVSCGVVLLAELVDAPRRSVERSLQRLREAGIIASTERGRGLFATIRLLRRETGGPAAAPIAALAAATPRTPSGIALPTGFCGDSNAYSITMVLARVRSTETPAVDLASRYLEHISPAEATRLASLRDDEDLYREGRAIVGDPAIDEGLRHLAVRDRRKRTARRFVAGIGDYVDPLADEGS